MANQEFKQKCIELRKQDFTLKEISQTLKRSKTSVYFHIKDIPKTEILLAKIRENNLALLKRIKPNLKGISWKGRHHKNFEKWTPDLVNLIAHTIFDGEFNRTNFIYSNRSSSLLNNLREKMKIIYDFEPKERLDKKSGVIRLEYNSVELTNFLVEKSKELLKMIPSSSISFQREFLKAFFDDEGCVTFKNNKRIIRGYQYDNQILFLVQKLLKNFGIESKVDARFYEIVISRRENLEKFAKEINFSAGLKVNGKRSNSIWKQDLEKREILRRALSSYL